MRPFRSLRALLLDVPPAHGRIIVRAMEDAGWLLRVEHADGAEQLSAALGRRGWGAVLYGGDGAAPVPARKALALVRLADPYLPFLAVSPYVHAGDLAAVVRGLDGAAAVVPDPAELPRALRRALEATRLRRRVGGAHRFLLAQQAITDHVAAGLEPHELVSRALATLGETLGWSCAAVWRPSGDGSALRCAATWQPAAASPEIEALTETTRATAFAAGQGLPGRVWAFRRLSWVPDVGAVGNEPRAAAARRAGVMTATAFPIAVADRCEGVIEFFSRGVSTPSAELSAMFATVGGQLAQYLGNHGDAAADGARRWLDAVEAPLLALDAEGRVLLANRNACALAGRSEAELLGQVWVEAAVSEGERAGVRAGLAAGERAEHVVDGDRLVSWQLSPLSEAEGVLGTWATGAVRAAPAAGSLEARLRRGVERDELRLHYQPIFDVRTGGLVALEALLRWEDPVRGLVSPAEFIPVAEASGVIHALGDWVLGAVCAQQAAWAAQGLRPHISFNVSPSQLRRADFIERVTAQVAAADAERLTVELTESSILEDAESRVRKLHALGLRIALDDFGTGYSSLSRLRELPVSVLKIDRAFLREVPERAEAAAVVTAILQLARALGRTAVVEGVETDAQHAFLAAEECPLAQGFLLGVPAPPDALGPLMADALVS
ncbi:MAG TPA: EAL domain-containing protein [Solirubrobacteraceae bacterium]|jgi:EAL domain-containing protein (putative c-di-GMP-specific phosphodiesterase class I)/PAS domain-containing protein|nr:EAL domain-containing protein [Solirubrobacteraceae bacterium]